MKHSLKQTYTVIGGGYVYVKYIAPLHKFHKIFVKRVIDVVDPKLPGTVFQRTNGSPNDIVNQIKKNASENEAILILTPPHTHLKILRALLNNTQMKIYLEKPAVTNLKDFFSINVLIRKYHNRVYFSEQYLYGRASILIQAFQKYRLQLGKIVKVELHLEEGAKYFREFQKWHSETDFLGREYFTTTRSWFADVGPELDLGVHLLSVLFSIFPNSRYKISNAKNPVGYLQNYGAEANIKIVTPEKETIPVLIRCGKKLGKSHRYIEIECEKGSMIQTYTSGSATDPVIIKQGKMKSDISHHTENWLYFEAQINNFQSWLNEPFSQEAVLRALSCALEIKKIRRWDRGSDTSKNVKTVAMIPARLNDYRVGKKNIRHLADKPLIYYAIKASLDAGVFDKIYVNSESDLIGMIGSKLGVDFYKRRPSLATAKVTNEEFVYDFLQKVKTKFIFMINPNKPMINPVEIRRFVKSMQKKNYDSMFSVKNLHSQAFFRAQAVNFSTQRPYLRSRDVEPIQVIQWSITGWKARSFLTNYKKNHRAVFSGKIGLFPVSEDTAFSIKRERDFSIAEHIMKLRLRD